MTTLELENELFNRITPDEWKLIFDNPEELVISTHNLSVLRTLWENVHSHQNTQESQLDESIPVAQEKVMELQKLLEEYLNMYMAEEPQGHKWIIIASLYLTYVQKLPMHPIELVHIEKKGNSYFCPAKDLTPGCICEFCACEKKGCKIKATE